jgi:glycosyltransferase involved in cell wall biosynthesis
MSIVIFGDLFSFPEGSAATNRVHTYAKGFYENGINVHVICFANEYNTSGDGQFNGIHYYHPFGQNTRSKYFILRRWQKFTKYIKTIALFRKINKEDKIAAINCWTQMTLTQIFAFFLAKLNGSKIVIEISEHPLRYYQGSFFNKMHGKLRLLIEIKLCDGILCISQYLVDFYKSKNVNTSKLFLIPSTVDPSRFIQTGENPFPFRYIGYFGGLTFYRDNIDLLIKAFVEINRTHSEVHLVLGGFCSDKEREQLTDLISQLGIGNKIELLGYISREKIINYITHSDVLVMVRSNDMTSQASFPSKLAEFLATSKPVVSVNVGEISDFLTDNLNAFLVEPGNINALTERINFVLDNYEFAQQVGAKGKELTNTIFNYDFQAKRMIDFIT